MTVKELKTWLEFQDENLDVVLHRDQSVMLRNIDFVTNSLRFSHPEGGMYKGSPFKRGEPGNDMVCTLEYSIRLENQQQ